MSIRVTDLRAELTAQLLGTHVRHPRLSWRLESDTPGMAQRSYRILAAASPAAIDSKRLWDSGIIASDASFDIPYGGPAPEAGERVFWLVEITTSAGAIVRSEPSWFEAGLLDNDGWQSAWLEAEDEEAAADRAARLQWIWGEEPLLAAPHAFRLDFTAPDDVVAADILLSGKDHLRGVWVNGQPAALDRPFGFDTHLPFWGTLTPFSGDIRPGRNCIAALVEADTSGFFPVDGGAFAALVRLHRRSGEVVRLASGPAHPATRPTWRVRPSPPAGWTAPAHDCSGWASAVPSGAHVRNDPRPAEPAMLLRRGFRITKPVQSARLYATALGAYEARLNGAKIGDAILAPEISVASNHVLYQIHDVTGLLRPGDNVLSAIVGDGWYAGAFGWRIERYGFGPAPRRFRAQLHIRYEDGERIRIDSGAGWKIAPSATIAAEIYDGERRDNRLRRQGWDSPGFDDSGWRNAVIGRDPGIALVPQTAPPLRAMHILAPVAVQQPRPGLVVADFGQNFAGHVRLRARGPAGTTIHIRHAELLRADGSADLSNLRLARATDSVTLAGPGADGAPECFAPRFSYHGFRYAEIEGYPGQPGAGDIEGVVVHSACPETGMLHFPDAPLLQKICSNALWSQRSNFFAVPTDCPQRDERMGWMGDIQIFLDAAAFNMDVAPFLRRYLDEARAQQRADGGYPVVVPQPLSYPEVVTAGWSEAGIILPWLLWQRYGDRAVIEENWSAMEAWMAFVARHNPDGIWRHDRGLDLGDWLSVDAAQPDDETTPRALCATAYWAHAAAAMAAMAEATGRADSARAYGSLRHRIGAAFARAFVHEDGRIGNGSQTSQVLALHTGLVPEGLRARAAEVLAADIRRRGMKLSTGFLGTPWLLDVLADHGHHAEAEALLLQQDYPGWGYMIRKGATTMWERWNGDTGDLAMNSYNHYAFGAIVGFFYRRLAGIAPAAPGFRRIAARPLWYPGVGRVHGRYRSVVGTIETETAGSAKGLTDFAIAVPANSSADVMLPGAGWHLDGAAVADGDGLSATTVLSGKHRFTRSL